MAYGGGGPRKGVPTLLGFPDEYMEENQADSYTNKIGNLIIFKSKLFPFSQSLSQYNLFHEMCLQL